MQVQKKIRVVSDLLPGEEGVISGFTDQKLALKLMEMGCLPGERISMNFRAPLGDPICYTISGYHLSLRKDEANTISLE